MNNFPTLNVILLLSSLSGNIQEEDILPKASPSPVLIEANKQVEVPFTSQAPESIWTEPWKNACEETSIVMVEYYYKNQLLDGIRAKQGILNVITTKEANFGPSLDENVDKMIGIIEKLGAHFKAYVKINPTQEEMIYQLSQNHPIILPVYGHDIPNPSYSQPPPNFHTLVLIGYDQQKGVFKVHDPGTGNGKAMEFSYEVIMNAIHDLSTPDYRAGEKKVIFTKPL